jgi:hypothetical protein
MLWQVGWSFHLVFLPFCHEIDQCLRLDGGARLEVESKSLQFHCPLGDKSSGIPIVEYIREWEISDN